MAVTEVHNGLLAGKSDNGNDGLGWEERFDNQIKVLLTKNEIVFKEVMDIVWQIGILDRLAPVDEQVIAERKKEGRRVWEKGRQDPEFYYRIIYNVQNLRYAIEHNYSLMTGWLVGIIKVIGLVTIYNTNQKLFVNNNYHEVITEILDDVIARSQEELQQFDIILDCVYKVGDIGTIWGHLVTISSITVDGCIALQATDMAAHMHIGELTNYSGVVSPMVFHQKFVLK